MSSVNDLNSLAPIYCASAYLVYMDLRIFSDTPTEVRGEQEMPKTRCEECNPVVGSVVAGLRCGDLHRRPAARAVTPTDGAASVATSPGAAAIEKAAKNNKYLFIFFFAGQDANTGRHERRLSDGDGEDDRPGRCDWRSTLRTPPKSRSWTSSACAGLPCRWCWLSLPPGLPPALSPSSSTRPNFNRRSSAPARPSA